jgi:DNA invertase Pin-like site-specific DNA recombinase
LGVFIRNCFMCRVIAYYRVSTEEQGRSGLGLEAQRQAVLSLCNGRGWEVIDEHTEVESGKRSDRPALAAAMHHAKITGAILVVAKLDRLSRSVTFLSQLQDSGAKFVAADMPEANELTVHIMAAVAQAERKAIGRRTKEALEAAKARGTWAKADGTPYKAGKRLGNPNGAAALRRAGKGNTEAVAALRADADSFALELLPRIEAIRASGSTSLPAIANALNDQHIQTRRGGIWHPTSVKNLLARLPA